MPDLVADGHQRCGAAQATSQRLGGRCPQGRVLIARKPLSDRRFRRRVRNRAAACIPTLSSERNAALHTARQGGIDAVAALIGRISLNC